MQATKLQKSAFDKLKKYKVGALFMEPGTGKTFSAYKLINSVEGIDYVLWLTPFRTKENLQIEINKCGGFFCNFEIQGIESLSNSDRLYLELINRVNKAKKPFIIVDESLKIKNFEAKRTKRIIKLSEVAEYKLILNGTPLSKNISDLWAQFEFLSPKILKMRNQEYLNTFCKYTTIKKKIGRYKYEKTFIDGYANIDYLHSLIDFYIYQADLSLQVAEQYQTICYELTDDEVKKHEEIKSFYLDLENMMFFNNNIFLRMTQQLQYSYSCASEKFERLESVINGYVDTTLVFCKYINSSEKIRKMYPNLRVLTYGKHAYGLNLQEYNRIVFFDKTFDYALRLQAQRRIFRTGQKSNVIYFDFTGNVGLESVIDNNINKKQSMLDYFKKKTIKELMKEL